MSTNLHEHAYGAKVRWANPSMRKYTGDVTGTITMQPVGSVGKPPPGGVYVLWKGGKVPMACFLSELESA